MHNDLATFLRIFNLVVEEPAGWQTRGRPFTFDPEGVLCHHTASNRKSGNFASESIVISGRPDLHGPLCHCLLGRNGFVKVIAGGYANHAGAGGPIAGISEGNTHLWGIEAENDGVGEPWPEEQLLAYYRLAAALLIYSGSRDVSKVFGHKEWAPTRKIDPAGIDMNEFRKEVKKHVWKAISFSHVKPKGSSLENAKIKRVLANKGFMRKQAVYSPYFGYLAARAYKKYQLSLGYTSMRATGKPDKNSLKKLGFYLLP